MGGFRFGVFAQLITSFALAVVFTVAAAGVGIFSIQKFNKGIEEVALSRLPINLVNKVKRLLPVRPCWCA
ncbi:exported hypothetical protein [Candidatus Terasakiella magnetica]|uniref:Uncharacterized protein n=1 Tax=Candidatus Terasakiella magnetica TaxID=1867952 RepID=A0A1C3RL49_9PROT|nr:hypothetical protein [Candidatus Terasakiella magnetica]SCA58006.1 exported hypothetical protein [Candidatus Terasakiella magnetica]